jgi:ribosomal protein L11 methyltransferase
VANIISDIIIKIADKARDLVADNGVFIVSGIILDRLDEVKSALAAAEFEIKNIEIEGEWAVIVCE